MEPDTLPLARPVGLDAFVSRPFHSTEPAALRVARLSLFHVLNAALGLVGFVVVVAGLTLGVALPPLCCFGVVVFRLLGVLVHALVDGDVALHNFVTSPDQQIRSRRHERPEWFQLMGISPPPAPAGAVRAWQPLVAALYFLVVKFSVAMLNVSALAFAFAFPVTTVSVRAMRETFFANALALVGFALLAGVLFVLGTAFMAFTADISCAITRFVCSEKPPPHRHQLADDELPVP